MSDILPRHWKELDSSRMVTKFDNLGNALLHALDEILCGSSNYRPLIPASTALHDNCSVILTILPDHIHWLVLHCTWNAFTVQNMLGPQRGKNGLSAQDMIVNYQRQTLDAVNRLVDLQQQ